MMKIKLFIQKLDNKTRVYSSNAEKASVIKDIEAIDSKEIIKEIEKLVSCDFELFLYTAKKRNVMYYYQSDNNGLHSTYIYPTNSAEGEYLWEFQSAYQLTHEKVYNRLEKKGYRFFKLIQIEQQVLQSSTSSFFFYLFIILLLLSMIVGNI